MKYVVVLPDGAADEATPKLKGRTPLQVARKSNMDWVADHGRQGCVVTVPEALLPGTDVATLSLMGYDPLADYTGRAPLEAVAQGIGCADDEIIFRCNFVTIAGGRMLDFTADHISQCDADCLIDALNEHVADDRVRFHAGVSYRNLMIVKGLSDEGVRCTPPHDIPDQPIAAHLPTGTEAEFVRGVMERAQSVLADHEVNALRRRRGEREAGDIWLWGQGRPAKLEPFAKRYGCRGACIAAVDVIRGLALAVGLDVIDVKGATGYLDTDYAAKGRATVEALERFDLVVVHVEAADEAGHLGDAEAKVSAIEQIDEHIVGPALDRLRRFERWRMLIAPDHPTPVDSRVHTRTPPPFCMAGAKIEASASGTFCETQAAATGWRVDPGHRLMRMFVES